MARLVRTSLEANVPLPSPLRPGGGEPDKAARLHAYHEPLKLDSVEEPTAVGHWMWSCGSAPPAAAPTSTSRRASGRRSPV